MFVDLDCTIGTVPGSFFNSHHSVRSLHYTRPERPWGRSKTKLAEASTSDIQSVSATSKCRIWSQTGARSNTFRRPIAISVNRRMIRAIEARDWHTRCDEFLNTTEVTYVPAMIARMGWSSRKCKRAGPAEVKSCSTDAWSDVAGKGYRRGPPWCQSYQWPAQRANQRQLLSLLCVLG